MNILDYVVITLAPSLTLGGILYLAKNWFLERLKNSIKHEYDISLEKLKGVIKSTHDKELEDLKAFLKKQTDINLEDYRFQIEIRKKWLDDFKNLCSIYLGAVKENVDRTNKYIVDHDFALGNVDEEFNILKEAMKDVGQLYAQLKLIQFKIELLINDCGKYGEEINRNMCFIENWIRTELDDNFAKRIPLDFGSEKVLLLSAQTDSFKANVKKLLEEKSTKL
ncbi:hypothetical protein F892_01695 [Acinetobacter vivianii]|uniref:Uncharacterized protein n=1 Tax=Acinetobacter vivianii TaxID=1776742 RepID=N9NN87_9GAMM|nr:hypothetical protein [Acinetobacter vivianii]ENX22453.1 hypothetical protein F892_01695 [Acinetobacter vivianii]GGI58822.1 hypothetical protein GCM10011446_03170 [Acinetobacter vivianii]